MQQVPLLKYSTLRKLRKLCLIKTFQLLLEKNMLIDFLQTEMWYDFETQSYSQTKNVSG